MPGTLVWQRSGLGDACQSGKMATPLNSFFFVFNFSLLPDYWVNIIILSKWCSGIACNWSSLGFCIIKRLAFSYPSCTFKVANSYGLSVRTTEFDLFHSITGVGPKSYGYNIILRV